MRSSTPSTGTSRSTRANRARLAESSAASIWGEDNTTPNSLRSFDMYNLSEDEEDLPYESLLGPDKSSALNSDATENCPVESLVPSITGTLALVPSIDLQCTHVSDISTDFAPDTPSPNVHTAGLAEGCNLDNITQHQQHHQEINYCQLPSQLSSQLSGQLSGHMSGQLSGH